MKRRVANLKRDAIALTIAARDPRVPCYAKVFMGLVVAYAFSPIDLIPDFIPVFGYLDDLIIVPLGIALSLKMMPAQVMIEARLKAENMLQQKGPVSRAGVVLVIAIWLIMVTLIIWFILRKVK